MYNSIDNNSFVKVCHLFELVHEDLEDAPCSLVNDIVGKFQKLYHAFDSSGLEGDKWHDHLELVKEVRARE